jgi:hypothetical protein
MACPYLSALIFTGNMAFSKLFTTNGSTFNFMLSPLTRGVAAFPATGEPDIRARSAAGEHVNHRRVAGGGAGQPRRRSHLHLRHRSHHRGQGERGRAAAAAERARQKLLSSPAGP